VLTEPAPGDEDNDTRMSGTGETMIGYERILPQKSHTEFYGTESKLQRLEATD